MTPAPHSSGRPLAALRATVLEHVFRSWRGRSGRRYIFSVHPVEEEAAFDCARAVVAAVRPTPTASEIAFVFQPGAGDFASWARRARMCGANAFHVHLLADSQEARSAVAEDLRPAPRFAI